MYGWPNSTHHWRGILAPELGTSAAQILEMKCAATRRLRILPVVLLLNLITSASSIVDPSLVMINNSTPFFNKLTNALFVQYYNPKIYQFSFLLAMPLAYIFLAITNKEKDCHFPVLVQPHMVKLLYPKIRLFGQ